MNEDDLSLQPDIPRFSIHRPSPITLPTDPTLATAAVVALINGDDGIERAAALESLNQRASLLASANPERAIEALATHLPVLHALFLFFTAEAVASRNAAARAAYVKIALNAQNAYSKTQALVIGLRSQQGGLARISLHADEGDDS